MEGTLHPDERHGQSAVLAPELLSPNCNPKYLRS